MVCGPVTSAHEENTSFGPLREPRCMQYNIYHMYGSTQFETVTF